MQDVPATNDLEFPNFRLDGRAALITGAGRGIGLGMARALAAAGCAVALQDIEPDVAAAEAGRINAVGGRAVALGGDVTDLSLPARLVPEAAERLGGLDILVNNASVQVGRTWTQQDAREMETQLRADLLVPILLAQQAVPLLRRRGKGRILNIGSIQALRGNPYMLAYSASKTALEAVTKALARDLAGDGTTVNLLAPGYFDTWRNRDNFQDEADKARKGKQTVPLGRLGQPGDMAGISVLLCSDAGAYITGQVIFVDGGMSVR